MTWEVNVIIIQDNTSSKLSERMNSQETVSFFQILVENAENVLISLTPDRTGR